MPPSDQNNIILARLYVLDFMTTALLANWLSAAPTNAEVTDRIEGIRMSLQPAIDKLPDPIRGEAEEFFTDKINRVDRDIRTIRATIMRTSVAIQ
jgi:hypothetical protein